MNWIKRWRLDRLREELAVVDAAIACDEDIARRCGKVYPVAAEINARQRARLMYRINRLESKK